MAEFENNSINQSNISKPDISPMASRLLKRKSIKGVILPKIKSKISKITLPSSTLKQHYLNPPGTKLRGKIKSFSDQLKTNKHLPMTFGAKKVSTSKSQSWDKVDMLLQNGASVESSTVIPPQPFVGGLSTGLPTGGQIIPPFDPPPISEGEPSFIARRRARLSAQEGKSSKPTPKKSDLPQRPFSKVEEIHPKTSRYSGKVEEVIKSAPATEEKSLPPEKSKGIEQEKQQKSEERTQKTSTKTEKVEKPTVEKSDHNQVVRRQIDEDPRTQVRKDAGESSEKTFETSRPVEEIKLPPDQEIKEDLRTLSSKKSFSKMDKDQNNQQQVSPEKLEDQKLIKNITEENQTKSPSSSINKLGSQREISSEIKAKTSSHIDEIVKDQSTSKPSGEVRAFEQTFDNEIQRKIDNDENSERAKTTDMSKARSSKETEKLALPLASKPLGRTKEQEIEPLQKMDLPLASKPQVQSKVKEAESSPKMDQKYPSKDLGRREEKIQSPQEKPEETTEQKLSKPVPTQGQTQKTGTQNINNSETKTLRTEPPNTEKLWESTKPEILDKPLVINKKSQPSVIKTFTNQIVKKNKQISQEKSKPVFHPSFDKHGITPAQKPVVQRQMTIDQEINQERTEPEVQSLSEDRRSESHQIDKPLRQQLQTRKDKLPSDVRPEKQKIDISPRNIRQRISEPANINIKRKIQRQSDKPKLPIILKSISKSNLLSTPIFRDNSASGRQTLSKDKGVIPPGSSPAPTSVGEPPLIRDQILVSMKGTKITHEQKNLSGSQPKRLFTPSLEERFLVSSAGRKTIQRKIDQSAQSIEKKATGLDENSGIPPEIISKRSQQKPGEGISKLPSSEISKSVTSQRKHSPRSEKLALIPLQPQKETNSGKSYPKPSDVELPVVKTKKVESSEAYFKPEMAVQGPVVQRLIESSNENIDVSPQPTEQVDVKVDLEKLAKDVYPIIKRWIAIEKERTSGRLF